MCPACELDHGASRCSWGLNDDGVMVGYFQDATLIPANGTDPERTVRVTYGITLSPVEALPGTSFEDSEFDHVNGPI